MSHSLSDTELNTLSIIERVCSSLSLAGCLITIVSFLCSAKFRKPINRLVFYATFGNLIANVATLMAGAFSASPRARPCQFQGFLIQMFIPADAYWTLVMAINVHLTFYNHFDAHKLRAIEWPYVFVCYGIPFIPALVFLFVRGHGDDKPYGNATLWCWLTPEWNVYRVAFFYAPVWLTIVLTIIIYARAGRMIFRIRNQLKNFQSSNHDTVESMIPQTVKTTEVTIQSEPNEQSLQSPPSCPISTNTSFSGPSSGYTVSIGVEQPQTLAELLTESSETLENPENPVPRPEPNTMEPIGETVPVEPIINTSQPIQPTHHHHHNFHPHLPHHLPNFHLHSHIHIRHHRHLSSIEKQRRHALNKAAWSYTKCAMLFFTAMLITWIPASVNRLYSYTHDNKSSLVLEVMSALVLPMQGFWNFTIYAAFSSDAFKDRFHKWGTWSINIHQILSSISRSSNNILWWNRKVSDVSTADVESTRWPPEPINNV